MPWDQRVPAGLFNVIQCFSPALFTTSVEEGKLRNYQITNNCQFLIRHQHPDIAFGCGIRGKAKLQNPAT